MRLRHIALGCALTGGLGLLALPTGAAFADNAGLADSTVLAENTVHAHGKGHAPSTRHATSTKHPGTSGHPGTTGDAHAKPVTSKPAKPGISVSSAATDYPYDAKVTLTVTLKTTGSDHEVSLYAMPSGAARELVATGTVDAKGKWYVPYTITKTTKFTAVFTGDADDAAASASRTLSAHARVTDRLTGGYTTSKSSSGVVYDVFHSKGTLTLYSTVAPNKHGECLEPESQQYDKGTGWHVDTKYGCDKLDHDSHDAAPFSLGLAVGGRYRIRGDYRRGKDGSNLDAQGRWLYFIVAK
jgi:hypothetical protein